MGSVWKCNVCKGEFSFIARGIRAYIKFIEEKIALFPPQTRPGRCPLCGASGTKTEPVDV